MHTRREMWQWNTLHNRALEGINHTNDTITDGDVLNHIKEQKLKKINLHTSSYVKNTT